MAALGAGDLAGSNLGHRAIAELLEEHRKGAVVADVQRVGHRARHEHRALALPHVVAGGLAGLGGVALLASEYPEHLEAVWDRAPDYVHRAGQIFATLSRLTEKFAEDAKRGSVISFDDAI